MYTFVQINHGFDWRCVVSRQVRVLYDPADVDLFIAVADAIEEAFPALIVEGMEADVSSDGSSSSSSSGRFTMSTADGRILFERTDPGHRVDPAVLVQLIEEAGRTT